LIITVQAPHSPRSQHFGKRISVLDFNLIIFTVDLEVESRLPPRCSQSFLGISLDLVGLDQARRNHSGADGAAADTFEEIAPRYPFATFYFFHRSLASFAPG
jgi:hypothetical protein